MAIFGNKMTKDATDAKKATAKKVSAPKKASSVAAPKAVKMTDLYTGTETSGVKKATATKFDGAHRVLVKPLVTEKAANFGALNKYVFVVTANSNKLEVAKAITAVYGVKPVSINIVCVKGKAVSRGRIKGRRSDVKKAIITLKKGDSIKIYEGV
jgi:large subunit ribosomal protein L23